VNFESIGSVDGQGSQMRRHVDKEKRTPCHSEAERGGGICFHHAASFLIKKDGAAILTLDVPYSAEEIEARMR
jgi:hypothetical protein